MGHTVALDLVCGADFAWQSLPKTTKNLSTKTKAKPKKVTTQPAETGQEA
jgi:hypothetical protein